MGDGTGQAANVRVELAGVRGLEDGPREGFVR